MPLEWTVLVAVSGLYWALGQITGVAKTQVAGTAWNRSNRDTEPEVSPWVKRTERAQRNLLESYPLFLSLVVVLGLSGRSDQLSALGALLWFACRLAHAGLFMAGVTGWRTGAYLLSLVGLALMLVSLAG
jgi:uncharacterized MAPEG superfamily protein